MAVSSCRQPFAHLIKLALWLCAGGPMDKDELNTILTDARVPEGLRDLVLAKGFDCPSDFAFAFPTIADLQPFIASATAFWIANQIEDPESSVAAARLRRALAECHRLCVNAPPAHEPSSASTTPALPQNQFSSWAKHKGRTGLPLRLIIRENC